MACQGTYTASKLNPNPSCITTCDGCDWTESVNVTNIDDGCIFAYTVNGNCGTGSGQVQLNCMQSSRVVFYCDSGGACAGFELVFRCDPEPI